MENIMEDTSCLRVSMPVKRHYEHDNYYKERHTIEVAYIFRGLVHYHHGVTWWLVHRHGHGEWAESPIFDPKRTGSGLSVTQS